MKKDEIIVVCESMQAAIWYIEDNLLPVMNYLKKTHLGWYESETFRLRALSIKMPDSLRGLSPDLIYASNGLTLKEYNDALMPLVMGDHNKIRIVM